MLLARQEMPVEPALASPWVCPLCGDASNSTIEHVIPRWLRNQTLDVPITVRYQTLPHTHMKVRVCSPCNSWLNSNFEVPARTIVESLVKGERIRLSGSDQRLVAAYLTKHVLLQNLWSGYPRDPLLTEQDCRTFRETGDPLPNTRVYLSELSEAELTGTYWVPPETQMFRPGSTGAILLLRRLMVRWFKGSEFAFDADQSGFGQRTLKTAERSGYMIRIWPVQLGGAWFPPPNSITFDDHVSLRDMFRRNANDPPHEQSLFDAQQQSRAEHAQD
jgi:hypothetical protein